MKREIKFRGLRTDGKGWVYGDLIQTEKYFKKVIKILHWSDAEICNEVIPESVGQFTGLKDKNGVDIYEGDILQGDNSVVYSVNFNKGSFMVKTEGFYLGDKSGDAQRDYPSHYHIVNFQLSSIKIIGNIHENPELSCK